jgi:hypothetical protein
MVNTNIIKVYIDCHIDEGFEADMYTKHQRPHTLCTIQNRHTGWTECCKFLASLCGYFLRAM